MKEVVKRVCACTKVLLVAVFNAIVCVGEAPCRRLVVL